MAKSGLVTLSMQDIYQMPTTQRLKYLTICSDHNEYDEYYMDECQKDKTPLKFSDWKKKYKPE